MGNAPTIDLIFDRSCPNVERTRSMIAAALGKVGVPAVWTEWDREAESTPAQLRSYGSPTVLVNGQDVGCDENDAAKADANACRVYLDDSGCLWGAPSADLIANAIRKANAR